MVILIWGLTPGCLRPNAKKPRKKRVARRVWMEKDRLSDLELQLAVSRLMRLPILLSGVSLSADEVSFSRFLPVSRDLALLIDCKHLMTDEIPTARLRSRWLDHGTDFRLELRERTDRRTRESSGIPLFQLFLDRANCATPNYVSRGRVTCSQ